MSNILTRNEFGSFLDDLVNSKIGQRINKEVQSQFTTNSDGEYPDEFWNELNRRHIEMLNEFVSHLSDIQKLFSDELN